MKTKVIKLRIYECVTFMKCNQEWSPLSLIRNASLYLFPLDLNHSTILSLVNLSLYHLNLSNLLLYHCETIKSSIVIPSNLFFSSLAFPRPNLGSFSCPFMFVVQKSMTKYEHSLDLSQTLYLLFVCNVDSPFYPKHYSMFNL